MLHTIENYISRKEIKYTHFCTECMKIWVDEDAHPKACSCGAKANEYHINTAGITPYRMNEVRMKKTPDGCTGINRYSVLDLSDSVSHEMKGLKVDTYEITIHEKPFSIELKKNGKPKSSCVTNIKEAMRRMSQMDFPMGTILHQFHNHHHGLNLTDIIFTLQNNPWIMKFYDAGDETFCLYNICRNCVNEFNMYADSLHEMLKISPKMLQFLMCNAVMLESELISLDLIWDMLDAFSEDEVIKSIHDAILLKDRDDFQDPHSVLFFIKLLLKYKDYMTPLKVIDYLKRDHGVGGFFNTMHLLYEYGSVLKENPTANPYPEDLATMHFFAKRSHMTEELSLQVNKKLQSAEVKKMAYVGPNHSIFPSGSIQQMLKDMEMLGNDDYEYDEPLFRMVCNSQPDIPIALIYVKNRNTVTGVTTPCYQCDLTHDQIDTLLAWAKANNMSLNKYLAKNLFGNAD